MVNSTGANNDLSFPHLDDYVTTGRPTVTATAAVEIAVGTISRALMAAQVEGATIPPMFLEMIGRQLCTRGNFVSRIELDDAGQPFLVPAYEYAVSGGVLPETWRYQMEFARPSDEFLDNPERRNLPAQGVVHIRYGADPIAPWKGIPALARGSVTAEQLAYIEDRLRADSTVPTGSLLPSPNGASSTSVDSAEAAVRRGQGGLTIIESMAQGWGAGAQNAPRGDWQQVRFGPMIQQPNVFLRDQDVRLLLQQLGVPAALLDGAGAALRESNRFFLVSTLEPLGAVIEAELSLKLDREVTVTFPEIVLGDIAARARALPNFINAGIRPIDALDILRIPTAGITLDDDFGEPTG